MKIRVLQKGVWPLVAGLLFSLLWSSAATATKVGLQVVQPFSICVVRFFLAGILMILISHLVLRQRLSARTVLCLVVCMAGVVLAAWPLLRNSAATPVGLLILLVSMIAYSVAVFYFSRVDWRGLPLLAINGWQVLMGGVFLLPLAVAVYRPELNHWGLGAFEATGWLAIPVSIGAVQLWFYLLKQDAARSSFWLFLCPVFGFVISNVFTGEPITGYTIGGMVLVIGGIYWQNRRRVA